MPKTKYAPGQTLYVAGHIPGVPVLVGHRALVLKSFRDRGAQTRYLVDAGQFAPKVYCYESDLSEEDPLEEE
jgi:hypothetical protein